MLSLILFTFLVRATPPECEVLVTGGILNQISAINPELASTDWQTLYLNLKREEREYERAKALPAELAERIKAAKGRQFVVETLNDAALVTFYQNTLNGFYARVAEAWMRLEVKALLGSESRRETEDLLVRMIDTYASAFGLGDRHMSLESATAFFIERPYRDLDWTEIARVFDAWVEVRPTKGLALTEFRNFWDTLSTTLTVSDYERMRSALLNDGEICCRSNPGCVQCPNNLRWLRPRSKAPDSSPSQE